MTSIISILDRTTSIRHIVLGELSTDLVLVVVSDEQVQHSLPMQDFLNRARPSLARWQQAEIQPLH
jgi:hypothetical protein